MLCNLWDSFVEKASSSKSSPTSLPNDYVRQEIAKMLESAIEARTGEGSNEQFYATWHFINTEYRDVFTTLKTPQGKLAWLKRTCEERKKWQRWLALYFFTLKSSFVLYLEFNLVVWWTRFSILLHDELGFVLYLEFNIETFK